MKTAFAWICGLERNEELDVQSVGSEHASYDPTATRPSICVHHEPNVSWWHKHCSYAAIVILSLCIFVWAFFTDYRIRLN